MQTLSETRVIELITQRKPIHARVRSAACRIRVDHYVPVVVTVLHAGSELTADYSMRLALDKTQRNLLEETGCDQLAELMPISLICEASPLSCDLSAQPERALPDKLGATDIWRRPPTQRMQKRTERIYRSFYRILDALVDVLGQEGASCLVLDLHSREPHTPDAALFRIQTSPWRAKKDRALANRLQAQLADTQLPQIHTTAGLGGEPGKKGDKHLLNSAFEHRHTDTSIIRLVLTPIFRDENSRTLFPVLTDALATALHQALLQTAADHSRTCRGQVVHIHDLLPDRLPAEVLQIDRALKKLARGLETLLYINPVNLNAEKRRFLRSHGRYTLSFRYRPLKIDPFAHREALYRLPVDRIREPALRQLYREVIDALAQRIDLLVSIGSDRFLYNSLRYYGEPDDTDLANARFLLHAADREQESNQARHDAHRMTDFFTQCASRWGLDCRVELSDRILSAAMVSGGRRTLLIRRDAVVSESELHALAHHELGIHMVTTLNARTQPLQVFTLGLPGNTHTQEGLAILSEYLCGHLTLGRLKTLALRVIAVHQMLHHNDIGRTWRTLVEDYSCTAEEAFRISARVHRGGGFTKDYLYLSGFREALGLFQQTDLRPLLVGKTGFTYLPQLRELLERGLIQLPHHLPPAFDQPVASHPEIDYLVRSIR